MMSKGAGRAVSHIHRRCPPSPEATPLHIHRRCPPSPEATPLPTFSEEEEEEEEEEVPFPSITLCNRTSNHRLLEFMRRQLRLPLTPKTLLSFLKNKLHHHPSFTHLDLRVFNWATRVDTFRHDHTTYSWMVQTLASTHRFSHLLPLLRKISSSPCPCSPPIFCCPSTLPTFTSAISALCRSSLLPQALTAFSLLLPLLDSKPPVSLFNLLIHSSLKLGLHSKALHIFHSMHTSRVHPDIFTFNLLLLSHCKSSRLDLAMDVFRLIRTHGCSPDVVTFNTLITGFMAAQKLDQCVEMALEMVDLGFLVSNATCEIVGGGLCEGGRVADACRFLMKLCGRKGLPSGLDCGFIVERLCRGGKEGVLEAVKLVMGLWEGGYPPSMVACIVVLDGLRKEGEVEEARGMMERMLEEGIVTDSVTFNCILEALCERGRSGDADRLMVLGATKGLKPNELSFKILVSGYAREGREDEVRRLVDNMMDEGFIPDITTHNFLINLVAPPRKNAASIS